MLILRRRLSLVLSVCLAAAAAAPVALRAWNYPGHRIVNQLALQSLPPDFPAFVRTPENAERIAYLAGEPDRWRDTREELLEHANGMDHYIDLEQLPDAGINLATLTPFRYEFAAEFAAGRAAHPDKFPPIDLAKDRDRSREWPGFLPWTIAEDYAKLRVSFSDWKVFQQYGGTPAEIANAEANIVYLMGVMGHFVGDGAQPLHTTVHHHGWVGPNPHGYTTDFKFHAWIDGGFIAKAHITTEEILPQVVTARPLDLTPQADGRDPVFVAVMDYLEGQNKLVEPLYQLEKAGKLKADGSPGSFDGRGFIDAQLLKGGEMLGALWLTAWHQANPDLFYLRAELLRRNSGAHPGVSPSPSPSR